MHQERYEVKVRVKENDNRWTMFFHASSFAHAEKQAEPYVTDGEEIVEIVKDYGDYGG